MHHLLAELQTRLARAAVRGIAFHIFRFQIEVCGLEHLPPEEPFIVAGGPHRNWIDGFLLLLALPAEPRLVFLASEEAADSWWKRAVLWLSGRFEPVSRSSPLPRAPLTASLRVLARGDRLGIFPEGWDHLDGPQREIGSLRRGVAFIAQRAGCRVVPVALAGGRPLWRGKTLRIAIGPPLAPPPPDAGRAAEQAWSETLRVTLQQQLPAEPSGIPARDQRWTWLTTWLN